MWSFKNPVYDGVFMSQNPLHASKDSASNLYVCACLADKAEIRFSLFHVRIGELRHNKYFLSAGISTSSIYF